MRPLAPVTVTFMPDRYGGGCLFVHPGTRASTLEAGSFGADHRSHMSIISIQNLTKDFGPVRAVDDLSFDIDEGKVVGFLGPNGSGKTTTLRSLVGLVTPTSGTATIDGLPYTELRDPLTRIGVMLEAASHPRGRLATTSAYSRSRAASPPPAPTRCSRSSTSRTPRGAAPAASRSA